MSGQAQVPPEVRRAIVLAAGVGSRIHPFTVGIPKPLVPLNGRALVSYSLEALAANGIEDVVIVVGYRERLLRDALGEGAPLDVRFVSNPRFTEGASTSLAAARRAAGADPFLLLMADHVVAATLLETLLAAARPTGATVAADFASHPHEYEQEATRLDIEGGRVQAIGKHLERWQALDTGAFVCTPDVWGALDRLPTDAELSSVFAGLIATGELYAADVTGHFWYDVDTPEDLAAASAALAAAPRRDR